MRLAVLLGFALTIQGSDTLLDTFVPSRIKSAHGQVSLIQFSTPLIELDADSLAFHLPRAMMHFRFAEPVWIIAYETEMLDAQGRPPRDNHLCHTFFGDQRVVQSEDQEVRGVYSDAFTPEVHLPDGFGVPLAAEETLHWMPMFNNRGTEPVRVRMNIRLHVIREKDRTHPIRALYATLRSAHVPHLYFVKPGRDEREAVFPAPFNGRIHFLGTHIHPHGVSVELWNSGKQQLVWKGARRTDGTGRMETMSKAAGYPVAAGETYRVKAVYENPSQAAIDAMGGIYILYSRE